MAPSQGSSNVALVIIYKLGKILSSSLELHKTLRQVLNVIAAHLNLQRGMVCMREDSEDLTIIASTGFSREAVMRGRFRSGEGVTGRIFLTGFPAVIPDVAQEPLLPNQTGAHRLLEGKRKQLGRVNTDFTPALSRQPFGTGLIWDAIREARRAVVPLTTSGLRQRRAPKSAPSQTQNQR